MATGRVSLTPLEIACQRFELCVYPDDLTPFRELEWAVRRRSPRLWACKVDGLSEQPWDCQGDVVYVRRYQGNFWLPYRVLWVKL